MLRCDGAMARRSVRPEGRVHERPVIARAVESDGPTRRLGARLEAREEVEAREEGQRDDGSARGGAAGSGATDHEQRRREWWTRANGGVEARETVLCCVMPTKRRRERWRGEKLSRIA